MISRRLLRIKALAALYAYNRREDEDLPKAENELMFSIHKTYDLYHYLLLLILELGDVASGKIEQARQKKMPSPEDLNPNLRFVNNKIIELLRKNRQFRNYLSERKLSWVNNMHTVRILYNKMVAWDGYNQYMKAPEDNFQHDRKFIISLLNDFLGVSEDLFTCLEELSIYWNDDMEYVLIMIDKTLKKFKADSGDDAPLMPLFKNSEDEEFVKILFRKTVLNTTRNSELVDNNTTNWELERIALMDILVMQLAVTEILEFPEIPVKVTLNEYIEIAKFYCTSKSSTFVNGILDNIVREIREKGLFSKKGRGLVGESPDDEE